MKLFPEKRRFVKSFCALSVMTLMVCSSLSAAAAIVNAAASETVSVPQSTTQAVKPVASALKRVVLDVNGEQSTVLFAGKTVEELLRFAHVDILENRIVAPDLSASVTPFMAVTVRDAKPVEITADGKTLSSVRKMILTPGEMVVQPLTEKMLAACRDASEITVSITAEKA